PGAAEPRDAPAAPLAAAGACPRAPAGGRRPRRPGLTAAAGPPLDRASTPSRYPPRMRLYNTLSRAVEQVVPVEPGHVKIYACGPTVYRYAHLGNLRTYMLSDLIRRALVFEGLRVTLVMNITDVGHMTDESSPEAVDKML